MFQRMSACAAAMLAALFLLAGFLTPASAQTKAFRFEAVSPTIDVGERVRIAVRLRDPDGAPVPVTRVRVTSTRLDMGPDGMESMHTPLKPVDSGAPDVIAFETEIVMAGRWALRIEAVVEGETQAATGEVIFTAKKKKAAASEGPSTGERKILYYRNPMGLADISPVPKKDPMGMDYIPVYADEVGGPAGTVRVSLDKVQRAGVKIAAVEMKRLIRRIRGAGLVTIDESRLHVVSPKFGGFVQRLDVRTTGAYVRKGEPLFTAWIESEDVLRKQADYLSALSRGEHTAARAAQNLRLFDIPDAVIEEIKRTRAPVRVVRFDAPTNGTVLEKAALDGMGFAAGEMLFRIADLSVVWIQTEVAEQDLSLLRRGQSVHFTLPALPGARLEGRVDFIYPDLDPMTRTGKARIIVDNPEGRLKIGYFAHADIAAPVSEGPVPAVLRSAVIDDGTRRIVFVQRGEGLFEPRAVTLGAQAGQFVEIRDGVAAGEKVVVAGTFLIDAESNLQAALAAFTADVPRP